MDCEMDKRFGATLAVRRVLHRIFVVKRELSQKLLKAFDLAMRFE